MRALALAALLAIAGYFVGFEKGREELNDVLASRTPDYQIISYQSGSFLLVHRHYAYKASCDDPSVSNPCGQLMLHVGHTISSEPEKLPHIIEAGAELYFQMDGVNESMHIDSIRPGPESH